MPDIICTAECNPPCYISWGKSNAGGLLSLDTVTTGDSGEYTCIATRADGQTMKRTITVFVSGNCVFFSTERSFSYWMFFFFKNDSKH
jgi:hypothetical protein